MEAADHHGDELEDRAQGVNESDTVSTEHPTMSDALDWNGIFNLNARSLQSLKDYYEDETLEFLNHPHFFGFYDDTFRKDLFIPKNGNPGKFTDHGEYVGTITTARWDKKLFFRTFELDNRRVIIRLEDDEDMDASDRSESYSPSSVTDSDKNHATTTGEMVAPSVNTLPFEEVAAFEAWLDELREEFGRRIPAFAQEKGGWEVDRAIEVIEATISGRFPDPTQISSSKSSIVVRSWSRNHVFLTYDLLDKRRIVAPFPVRHGRTAYRRWRSSEKGFDTTALAFATEETDSKSIFSTDSLLGNRPEPFEKRELRKEKQGNTATHRDKESMNRVANKPLPSKIQKVQKAQKQRHGSIRDRGIIDLISPTASSSRPISEKTVLYRQGPSTKTRPSQKPRKHDSELQTPSKNSTYSQLRFNTADNGQELSQRTQRLPDVSGTHQTDPTISRNANSSTPAVQTQQQQNRLQVIREQRRKIQLQMLEDLKEEETALLQGIRAVVE
ncbi:hypothetical protein Q9189_001887 [Teloschistes chrysophthalmus]